jgi:hypothetical protein
METPKSTKIESRLLGKQKVNPNQHKHPIHHNVPKVPKVTQSKENILATAKPKA